MNREKQYSIWLVKRLKATGYAGGNSLVAWLHLVLYEVGAGLWTAIQSRSHMTETSHPHSSGLRLHRRVTPGAFLITKCLDPRLKVIDCTIASEICSALCFYAREGQIHLAAFVVMLDHWHAVFATVDGKNISERMNIIDSWIGKQTEAPLRVLEWLAARLS